MTSTQAVMKAKWRGPTRREEGARECEEGARECEERVARSRSPRHATVWLSASRLGRVLPASHRANFKRANAARTSDVCACATNALMFWRARLAFRRVQRTNTRSVAIMYLLA